MKKVMIGLVVLMLFGGGNAGAWWYFIQQNDPCVIAAAEIAATPEGQDAPELPAQCVAIELAEGEVDPKTPAEERADKAHFVKMNQIIIPLIDEGNNLVQYVLVHPMLEVSDEKYISAGHRLEPKLRDAIYQSLYGALHSGSAYDANQVVILEDLKKKSLRAARKVMGEGVVTDVLILDVGQKPI
ncbi:MAG: hypothetical protein Alpg2KO_06710 [Alphaproteobacteria bacterium]